MTRLTRRRALLIGNEYYADHRFAPLPSVQVDTWQLQQVLAHRQIGAFEVDRVSDLTAEQMCDVISGFLYECREDELALLYVSGHGTRVVQSGGEFYFIATDTDFDRVADTGVSSGFVNERLELCVAPQKVVMIDCCRSGGFAVGLRTSDGSAKGLSTTQEIEAPLTSRGVYVLSSSRAGEDSYTGADTAAGIAPSVFTGEIVEALRTGQVGKDGTGEVSVAELFDFVNRRMRAIKAPQISVMSALGVDDRIIVASCPQGASPTLAPYRAGAEPVSARPKSDSVAATRQPTWSQLLAYYRACMLEGQAELPLMAVEADNESYVCLTGMEQFLSGAVDSDHQVALPAEAEDFVGLLKPEDELWAGYPAVVFQNRDNERDRLFAPLLMRRVEVVQTEDGRIRLEPSGLVQPHPGLVGRCMSEEEAANLIETYQPTWHAGQHDRMAVDIKHVLTELELAQVQELRPAQLADHLDVDTPNDGARNTAVLFRIPQQSDRFTTGLLKDLNEIEKQNGQIRKTALAALSPDPKERVEVPICDPESVRLVTPLPCNEGQESVVRAAMSRRLTVATGPPGTGKSQLVANLVATAVADGQKVLVASTNNAAVDEVWQRCEKLVPGCIVRTGSADNREHEAAALRALRALGPPDRNVATASAELNDAAGLKTGWRRALAEVADVERMLLQAGQSREHHADQLHIPVVGLIGLIASTQPTVVGRKATAVANARFFGEWRRRRLLGQFGIVSDAVSTVDACMALAGFAEAEHRWREARQRIAQMPNDNELFSSFGKADEGIQSASQTMLDTVVRTAAQNGRKRIIDLIQGDSGWQLIRAALPAIQAWAVTNLSVRRFPPEPGLFDLVIIDEASQCANPSVLPLLFRARRALIIGDPMQLQHIANLDPGQDARAQRVAGLHPTWVETRRLSYRRHSAFHAAELAASGSLLLDEHFRCHPRIAALVNDLFYDGQLTVLTDVRHRPTLNKPAIFSIPIVGRTQRSRQSWINPEEIDKVVSCVEHLLNPDTIDSTATIGVVTPFKSQADGVQRQLGLELDRVRIGTAHRFQGGECDVMIYSLVASVGMPKRSINWIDKQLNLWNVAITRARSHLIVIGDANLWQQRGGIGSALFDAADNVSGEHTRIEQSDTTELRQRLFRSLRDRNPTAAVVLDATVCGHRADALISNENGAEIAYVLDPGAEDNTDSARHLRLMLRHRELRDRKDGRNLAFRMPAWTLFDT